MNKILRIIGLSMLLPITVATAQDQQGKERGEVTDAEFIIRKDRVLTLPKRNRNFEPVPALPQNQGNKQFSYAARDFFFQLPPSLSELSPYQKKFDSTIPDLYHGYAKLGFGNYQSPLAEIYINNKESDYLNYGVKIRHQGFYEGPVDGANSAEDHTQVQLHANYFTEYFEVFGLLGYQRDRYHFYGYTPGTEVAPEQIQQLFNTIDIEGGIRNIDKNEAINYQAKLGLRLFDDDYLAREHEVRLESTGSYKIMDAMNAGLDFNTYFTSPSDQTYRDVNRNYLQVRPYALYQDQGLSVRAAVNMVIENDEYVDKPSDFHVFPELNASYYIQEEFALYGQVTGGVQRNTYYQFAQENPYLGPSTQLLNTVEKLKVEAGIKGSVTDAFTYQLGIGYGDYDNMAFYANSVADSAKFEILYNNGSVLNYTGNLGYNFSKVYGLVAEANYYHYSLDETTEAGKASSPWQRPEWVLSIQNIFTPSEQWLITGGLDMMGGIYAKNLQSGTEDTLKPIIDLNVKADYKITDRFSVFAQGNNLLNQKNERYWNYQSRGIQGIIGAGFKF
ncbi:TonB-dependent receptor [Echinicola pacifica]|nr:TonB-dependent receptor [Echinicola pacifica]